MNSFDVEWVGALKSFPESIDFYILAGLLPLIALTKS